MMVTCHPRAHGGDRGQVRHVPTRAGGAPLPRPGGRVLRVEGGRGWQPHAIARQDGRPIAFAGLWESFRWPDKAVTRSFTILTPTPNAEMSELHDRMPEIFEQQDWPVWLGETEGDYPALMRPAPDGLLRVWPVDRRVGSPRNNGPELLESIAA